MKINTFPSLSSVGDIKKGSGAKKLCYQTVYGSTINLDVINHQPSVCQEFIVTSPKFNYYRWMLWTVGFYALGCILQIHLQVIVAAALRSRCGHYIFAMWFVLSFFLSFFPGLIWAITDWISTILLCMVWP